MKHLHSNKILGRDYKARQSLMRILTHELLKHGAIKTTKAKAWELRRFFEPLVTLAKKGGTLAVRRRMLRDMDKESVEKMLTEAAQYAHRPGGYLRLTKLPPTRQDQAKIVRVEMVK